jgi:hypothetical protein
MARGGEKWFRAGSSVRETQEVSESWPMLAQQCGDQRTQLLRRERRYAKRPTFGPVAAIERVNTYPQMSVALPEDRMEEPLVTISRWV